MYSMKRLIWFFFPVVMVLSGCNSAEETTHNNGDMIPDENIRVLYVDIIPDYLLSEKYEVLIELDGSTVCLFEGASGSPFSETLQVLKGDHIISLIKADDLSVSTSISVNVKTNTMLRCRIAYGESIDIEDIKIYDYDDENAYEVPDVTDMILSHAIDRLKKFRFYNIKYEGDGINIENEDSWLVQAQSIPSVSIVNRHEEIVLKCTQLDDYFNNLLTEKSVADIEEFVKHQWFSVIYVDGEGNSLDQTINQISDQEKNEWFVYKAEQYKGRAEAIVYLKKE